jgi:hypothetical protein
MRCGGCGMREVKRQGTKKSNDFPHVCDGGETWMLARLLCFFALPHELRHSSIVVSGSLEIYCSWAVVATSEEFLACRDSRI